MKSAQYKFFEIQADFCKTLANPKRLYIICALKHKEMTVGEFSELLELPIANVSQHLKALRDQDMVTTRKEGQKVYYALRDQHLIDACQMIRKVIYSIYKDKGHVVKLDNHI